MNSSQTANFLALSQACSYSSLESKELKCWAEEIRPYWDENQSGMDVPLHRKIWEWSFIASTLSGQDMLKPGIRGLGFGVGKEPLVPLFAAQGCEIVATDQSYDAAQSTGWSQSNQYAGQIGAMNEKNLCDSQLFEKMVAFRTVDMRHIPKDLRGFDFTWSSCALEHLGGIAAGLKFVLEQMECLSPGGLAVHTTEFNLGSNSETIEKGPTVLFRRFDLERLSKKLRFRGNMVNLDFTLGSTEADLHVDSPPWSRTHLRLQHEGFIITSYGIVIKKGPAINKGALSKAVSLLLGSKRG